jgi:chromosomal replication initiator protein
MEDSYNVPNDVLHFIAEKITNNIREMMGLLSRVVLFASLAGKEKPDIAIATEALKDFLDDSKKEALTAEHVINAVCKYFNIERLDLIGKKKTKDIVEPRMLCIYLITELLPLPLSNIGEIFGGRDHTTIIHSRDKINEIKNEVKIKIALSDLMEILTKQKDAKL